MTEANRAGGSRWLFIGVALLLVVAGLFVFSREDRAAAANTAPPPPPEVNVVEVQTEDVPIFRQYPGRTYARDMVEVRGRVDGYIEQRTFDIGADVRAGQVLYVLDRRPYEADVDRARGALAQATADLAQTQANLAKARQDVARLEPLVKEEAAARQDLENAQAAFTATEAAIQARQATIEASRAQLRTAELNLEYATIRAPISGRIGDSLVQVGGLVTRTSAQPLTTIIPLDPIWVRFQVSEAELAAFQRRDMRKVDVELQMNDGSVHPQAGHIESTLNAVNTRTGTLEVQASFPNPERRLLGGQYGRVRIRVDERRQALLVPQQAVQETQGLLSVLTVGGDNVVQTRTVQTGERIDQRWIVEQGLKPGERVIVDGLQKARPGAPVTPKMVSAQEAAQNGTPAPAPAAPAQGTAAPAPREGGR